MKAWIAPLTLSCVGLVACSGTPQLDESSFSDSSGVVTESALAEANGQITASDTSGAYSLQSIAPDAVSRTACSTSSVRSACTGSGTTGSDTLTWGSCTINAGAITMTGGWNEQFSGTSSSATCTVPIISGMSVTRTSPTGSTAEATIIKTDVSITTDTMGGTAYDGTSVTSGGAVISNTSGTRSISLAGLHRIARVGGVKLFDHLMQTTTPLTVTGTNATNRTITGGVVVVYHNLANYKETLTFNNVAWSQATCCYPTSGRITGQYASTTKSGSTTMEFSSTCGTATFTDESGVVNANYQLKTCR